MLYGPCLALILFHVSQMSTSGSEDSSDDDEHFFLSFKVVLNWQKHMSPFIWTRHHRGPHSSVEWDGFQRD
jgi:hypothetical protein